MMDDIRRKLAECHTAMPDILMPEKGADMEKWAVIACDQYTSEPAYWGRVEKHVGDRPSTLRCVLPEYRLGTGAETACIANIHDTMKKYASDGTLASIGEGFILVRRETQDGVRLGLLACIDLESYDFSPDSRSPIRPTEGTIRERIPPRLRVRDGAIFELPHIMVLTDDPENTLIEPLYERRQEFQRLYGFELMMGGGRVEGWFIPGDMQGAADITEALLKLKTKQEELRSDPILFAVGDGNHSLATGKTHYENLKAQGNIRPDHPARYAMVEIVNLHSGAMRFHPIHRAVFGDTTGLPQFLKDSLRARLEAGGEGSPRLIIRNEDHAIRLPGGGAIDAIRQLEQALNEYAGQTPGVRIDYVHGEEALSGMAKRGDCAAVLMPKVEKEELFPYVEAHGPLPRKAFSIGHADDKRFYFEARKVTD